MRKDPESRPAYDPTKGRRGAYAAKTKRGTNLRHLSPEVAEAFPTSEAVNDALRAVLALRNAERFDPLKRRRGRRLDVDARLIDADLEGAFPTSESVNDALCSLLALSAVLPPRGRARHAA